MPRREHQLLIEDMLESIALIESYTAGLDDRSFRSDRKTLDAVVRNLEVLGEAASVLPQEVKGSSPQIDWRGVVGLRNRLIHEYIDVDSSIVWTIVSCELPVLKAQLLELTV